MGPTDPNMRLLKSKNSCGLPPLGKHLPGMLPHAVATMADMGGDVARRMHL